MRARTHWIFGSLAGLSTALLWIATVPPLGLAEGAYIALIPLLVWCFTRPPMRVFWPVAIFSGWLTWLGILVWLRHVTWVGTGLLSFAVGLFFVAWLRVARWQLPAMARAGFARRIVVLLGLAGFWVVLEWVRTWFLWGFPWAPLALSQWERPVILQMAAWTGAWGVSFLLVFFNLCIAYALYNRVTTRAKKLWGGWFSAELYLAIGTLALAVGFFLRSLPEPESAGDAVDVAVVQPYITPELKWDDARECENLAVLFEQTRFVGAFQADVILWPEAATPLPILGNAHMQAMVEQLADEIGAPILMGNIAFDYDGIGQQVWENGVFIVDPGTGLQSDYYVKRKLVPFGEYVPLRPIFGFIEKFVPVGGDFQPGEHLGLLELVVDGGERTIRVGSLICYEDIFPRLARDSVMAGAQVLFVAANNAWYGEEGGAYQHAAHSVLRAVENRRPVIRCGNGGWSGWIDSYGMIRDVITGEDNSVYFRGGGQFSFFQYSQWEPQRSFYTRYGDWFVVVSAGLFAMACLLTRRNARKKRPQPVAVAAED